MGPFQIQSRCLLDRLLGVGQQGDPRGLGTPLQPNEKEASYLRRTFVWIKISVPSFLIQRTSVFTHAMRRRLKRVGRGAERENLQQMLM